MVSGAARLLTLFWKWIVEPRASNGTLRIAFGHGCGRRRPRSLLVSPRCASTRASARPRWGCWDTRVFVAQSRTSLATNTGADCMRFFAEIDGQQRKIYVFWTAVDGLRRGLSYFGPTRTPTQQAFSLKPYVNASSWASRNACCVACG